MLRGLLAACVAALTLAGPAAACTAPYEPMPFPLYGPHGKLIIRAGQCVIDPGFWIYTPPPHSRLIQAV